MKQSDRRREKARMVETRNRETRSGWRRNWLEEKLMSPTETGRRKAGKKRKVQSGFIIHELD